MSSSSRSTVVTIRKPCNHQLCLGQQFGLVCLSEGWGDGDLPGQAVEIKHKWKQLWNGKDIWKTAFSASLIHLLLEGCKCIPGGSNIEQFTWSRKEGTWVWRVIYRCYFACGSGSVGAEPLMCLTVLRLYNSHTAWSLYEILEYMQVALWYLLRAPGLKTQARISLVSLLPFPEIWSDVPINVVLAQGVSLGHT